MTLDWAETEDGGHGEDVVDEEEGGEGEPGDGGRALVAQLMEGRGTGQAREGYHNINLR